MSEAKQSVAGKDIASSRTTPRNDTTSPPPKHALEARHSFLKLIDQRYRQLEENASFGTVDTSDERALNIITSPPVRAAFDLSKEPTKIKEAYGPGRVGQGALLARRLVEAGCRFVTME